MAKAEDYTFCTLVGYVYEILAFWWQMTKCPQMHVVSVTWTILNFWGSKWLKLQLSNCVHI